jgi:hypothetical protein
MTTENDQNPSTEKAPAEEKIPSGGQTMQERFNPSVKPPDSEQEKKTEPEKKSPDGTVTSEEYFKNIHDPNYDPFKSMDGEIPDGEKKPDESEKKDGDDDESKKTTPEEEIQFDVNSFNSKFNTSFKDETSITSALESVEKTKDLEEKLSTFESSAKDYEEKTKQIDAFLDFFGSKDVVKELYGSEEKYAALQFDMKFPGKDQSLVSLIRSDRFNTLSPVQRLIVGDKLRVQSNVSDDVRQKRIFKNLGIESEDLADLTQEDQYLIDSAVQGYQKEFDEIRNFKPDKFKFDIHEAREVRKKEVEAKNSEMTTKWTPVVDKLVNAYEKAKYFIKDDKGERQEIFDYAINDKLKEGMAKNIVSYAVNSRMDVNEDNIKLLANHVDSQVKSSISDQAISQAIEYGKTLATKKEHDETNNSGEERKLERVQGDNTAMTLKERYKRREA